MTKEVVKDREGKTVGMYVCMYACMTNATAVRRLFSLRAGQC